MAFPLPQPPAAHVAPMAQPKPPMAAPGGGIVGMLAQLAQHMRRPMPGAPGGAIAQGSRVSPSVALAPPGPGAGPPMR